MSNDVETKRESRYERSLAFERLVKNSLFTVIFSVVASLSVRLFVWEHIEKFRVQHGDTTQKHLIAQHREKNFLVALQEYRSFKDSSAPKLTHLSYQASIGQLNQLLNRYFYRLQMQAKPEARRHDGGVIHEILAIKAHARSLSNLYDFLDGMGKINAYIQVDLPITISKDQRAFALSFNIHVEYKSSDL
ncbi:hypothetical protein [Helicobacter felis]|uniref:Membrane protein n=1 Tax=Helicobacter felis (strain ATCC 49179 / CCUG 28539 / NCTC 12436 / CS1) TaxID=936155 RepID=E7AD69_HELFC|nr:hypothetical protein [Helicobacter felis]CBY82334.1 Putative membrane protein [Helicobacter felis ATCC 49179]